jgi:hypothetical protein
MFNGILNPKQLEGLRLLVTPFAQIERERSLSERLSKTA